jgi:hypothetical protein
MLMPCVLQCHGTFDHEAIETTFVLDPPGGEITVVLEDVLELEHDVLCREPSATQLNAIYRYVRGAREVTIDHVLASAQVELVLRSESI